MVIALFGLVGYTSDEVNRRRKEIAIRKVIRFRKKILFFTAS